MDWTFQLRHGNAKKQNSLKYEIADGEMVFDLGYEFTWGYFLYSPDVIYNNVELEAVIADLHSADTFGLICQYSEEQGWYEFDINGSGVYYVRYVDTMESDQDENRFLIAYGSISSFKDSLVATRENTIRVICNGSHLSLFVNDAELMNDFPSRFVLKDGQIGLSTRSYKVYPVHAVIKSITVREPEQIRE